MNKKKSDFSAIDYLKTVPSLSGVYCMLDKNDQVLYIGKSNNLKKRIASYFSLNLNSKRIESMVQRINNINISITNTDVEALLLESNLIKKYQPYYNILLRDDKSYPYIYLSSHNVFPRLCSYRGARKEKGRYFGPYPSSGAVKNTLAQLQKLFLVRQCEDSYFSHRSRPCLQYQIKRCSAPCTQQIDKASYQQLVDNTVHFLEGKSVQLIDDLIKQMDYFSHALRFEEAAVIRDRIKQVRMISEQQCIMGGKGNVDVIAIKYVSEVASIHVITIRNGDHIGSKNYFPQLPNIEKNKADILAGFITQYYLKHEVANEILVNESPTDVDLLEEMLTYSSGHRIKIYQKVRTLRAKWLNLSEKNALYALNVHLESKKSIENRIYQLQDRLDLPSFPRRIECFDISHTQGEATVASCVVFGIDGAIKSDYRLYNIKNITPGDDYAAMNQVIQRRFKKIVADEGLLPNLLLIDGGKGQVNQAKKIVASLSLKHITIIGVVKGEKRKAVYDKLIIEGRTVVLDHHSSAMHLIQQIRDEAHRFAITGHRRKRNKARRISTLDEIRGLGIKRRQLLLKHFGGLSAISKASIVELFKVKGISRILAERIYDHFNY